MGYRRAGKPKKGTGAFKSDAKVAKMIAEYEAGELTVAEIARKYRCSVSTLYYHIRRAS